MGIPKRVDAVAFWRASSSLNQSVFVCVCACILDLVGTGQSWVHKHKSWVPKPSRVCVFVYGNLHFQFLIKAIPPSCICGDSSSCVQRLASVPLSRSQNAFQAQPALAQSHTPVYRLNLPTSPHYLHAFWAAVNLCKVFVFILTGSDNVSDGLFRKWIFCCRRRLWKAKNVANCFVQKLTFVPPSTQIRKTKPNKTCFCLCLA